MRRVGALTLRSVRANHCCSIKSNTYYIFWVCVCVCSLRYPVRNSHAPYCHLWLARLYRTFRHYLINGTIFGKKVLTIKCVSWFCLQLLSEIFLILRRKERDMIKNVHRSSCKVPVILARFYLSARFFTSCRRLPETKRHSSLFLHWSGSKCLAVMAACTPSIHVSLGRPLFLLSRGIQSIINLSTPNDPYSGRTAPPTSKCCILYIYSTNIGTEYFKHCIYSPFYLLQNAVCFINLTYLVPVLFTFIYRVF